jgi:hypothetical protein
MTILPKRENLIKETIDKKEYFYCDEVLKPQHKTKVIFKNKPHIILYLYTLSPTKGFMQKKINILEFKGWNSVEELPREFRNSSNTKVGLIGKRIKIIVNFIHKNFPKVTKIIIEKTTKTRFLSDSIHISWNDLDTLLRLVGSEKALYDLRQKSVLHLGVSKISASIKPKPMQLKRNDLVKIFNVYDKAPTLSNEDIDLLLSLISMAPASQISVTENYIKTKEKINIAYLDDILLEYKKLLQARSDNEKEWQVFFELHGWILNNLFPYQVILRKREAYVGGKTIDNAEGRVVDFLFQNGFQDNYALLEIKTHLKQLLKSTPYRSPDVFSMTEDLSGAINQCNDQKSTFLKEFGSKYDIHEPKSILIIGTKGNLTKEQKNCFELLRGNQKNVEVVTFDDLLHKLEGLLNVLKLGSK